MKYARPLKTAAITAAFLVLTGCTVADEAPTGKPQAEVTSTPTPTPTPEVPAPTDDDHSDDDGHNHDHTVNTTDALAMAALDALPVKGRAPKTGYDRSQFGSEWSDAPGKGKFATARNGCDTRNDILARDLQRETVEANGCVVTNGVLAYEPYTGDLNRVFVKGGTYEQSFDVEHIVALGNAWVTGAQNLTVEQRAELANDPDNLMLTDPSLNRAKGDADFATWLPPNKEFRCSYAARQIRVKARYNLWVTKPEKDAMKSVLDTCAYEPLDQSEVQDGYTATDKAIPAKPKPKPKPKPQTTYYANCTAARDAGAAPVYRGDPGYGSHLDRDGDGVACE